MLELHSTRLISLEASGFIDATKILYFVSGKVTLFDYESDTGFIELSKMFLATVNVFLN